MVQEKTISSQKIVWWMLLTVTGVLISIAGGWVGSVNAYMSTTSDRITRSEAMIQSVNSQYATIIKEISKVK